MKRARQYCQSCGAFSHVTNDCWNLKMNAHKPPAYFAARMEEEETAGNMDESSLPESTNDHEGQTGTAD